MAIKCDGVKDSRRSLRHKVEAIPVHATMHGGEGDVIAGRLAGDVSKTVRRKIGVKDE